MVILALSGIISISYGFSAFVFPGRARRNTSFGSNVCGCPQFWQIRSVGCNSSSG